MFKETELKERIINLPQEAKKKIVILTGLELRHIRFALRIQEVFGDLVVAWYQISKKESEHSLKGVLRKLRKSFFHDKWMFSFSAYRKKFGYIQTIKKVLASRHRVIDNIWKLYYLYKFRKRLKSTEKHFFQKETVRLKAMACVKPVVINDPNDKEVVESIRELNPYFILTLGGPLYKKALISNAKGLALNQHAGWAPVFKGTRAVEWALYHRDLKRLGSTIHLLSSGADAGPIVRRAWPTLLGEDTPESCFIRVVILGTELMIEVIEEAVELGKLKLYEQNPEAGRTYLVSDISTLLFRSIYSDFKKQWLSQEIERILSF